MTATGLSGKKAAELCGFSNISSTVFDVEDVLLEATAIRHVIEKLAKLKDEELLTSFRITDENCCDSSSSESETDSDDVSDVDSVECEHNNTPERFRQNTFPQQDTEHFSKSHDLTCSTGEQCLDPRQLLVILQQCNWNWLESPS